MIVWWMCQNSEVWQHVNLLAVHQHIYLLVKLLEPWWRTLPCPLVYVYLLPCPWSSANLLLLSYSWIDLLLSEKSCRLSDLRQLVLDGFSVVYSTITASRQAFPSAPMYEHFLLWNLCHASALWINPMCHAMLLQTRPNPFLLYVCWRLEDVSSVLVII